MRQQTDCIFMQNMI